MLKSIDPLLGADLLHTLAAMGHGDRLVVADANFPADAVARSTTLGRPLHLAGTAWILAFGGFAVIYAPMLALARPVQKRAMPRKTDAN